MAELKATSVLTSATGLQLPVIGLGSGYTVDADLEAAMNTALEAGYRFIDTAYIYYNNETVIGKVLREWIEAGKLKREDFFICTKLPMFGNRPESVRPYLLSQLKTLQVDYLDLYLIHSPVGVIENEGVKSGDPSQIQLDMNTDLIALWKEMEKQVDEGLTKHIGVSNFNPEQMERILAAARIPPANLQTEVNIYQQAVKERALCAKHGITVTAYSSLGSAGTPAEIFSGCKDDPRDDPVVKRVAAAHNKTPGQVLLRYGLQLGTSVIAKSSKPERIHQNIQIFDFSLSEAEMEELKSLDRGEAGRRFCIQWFVGHPEFPYPATATL